jgi:hypothetical protein
VRVLGLSYKSTDGYLAVVEGGVVVAGLTERIQSISGLEAGEGLVEYVDTVRRVLREVSPARVGLLLPETWRGTYTQHLRRAELETMARLAAAMEEIPVDLLARATVRSRLGLPRSGSLENHVDAAGEPVGAYWSAGRGIAALAALACEAAA